jgi:hypothetical protein
MGVLLFFSLFFPRISLFIAYLAGGIPVNNVPLFFDVLGALVFPRILIMYYIVYADLGTGWLIAHIIALIIKMVINGSKDD